MNHLNIGSKILLLTCLLIHTSTITTNSWMKYTAKKEDILSWDITIGVVFLLYPLFGWIADVLITRYTMIKISFVLSLVACVLLVCITIERQFETSHMKVLLLIKKPVSIITGLVGVGSLGLYEANAIQFGLQQLQEASSETLSSFIHWYYWSLQLGSLAVYYISIPFAFYFRKCKLKFDGSFHDNQNIHVFGWFYFFPSILQLICISIGLTVIIKSVHKLDVHQAKINQFKSILKIIQYIYKHKQPERRSALTYWESKAPSRVDFGKQKYGGPFTNEEVEDMKTFFRLLALIFSLFGFFLRDEAKPFSSLLIRNLGCPKLTIFLTVVLSPDHIELLIVLAGIPLYQILLRKLCPKYEPNLLSRIWIGLMLCLIRQLVYPMLYYLVNPSNQQSLSCELRKLQLFMNDNSSTTSLCLLANTQFLNNNGTCGPLCPGVLNDSYLFYLLIIPQIIEGLSSLLVSMTVLEFLCAQGPHTMKGLLIGIWYAMLSIRYIAINTINKNLVEPDQWTIFGGIRGFGIFSSLLLYSAVCKFYRYRERNEVINEQAIIEEQYERELLLESRNNVHVPFEAIN